MFCYLKVDQYHFLCKKMAYTLNWSTFDPELVKSKWVWTLKAITYLFRCKNSIVCTYFLANVYTKCLANHQDMYWNSWRVRILVAIFSMHCMHTALHKTDKLWYMHLFTKYFRCQIKDGVVSKFNTLFEHFDNYKQTSWQHKFV